MHRGIQRFARPGPVLLARLQIEQRAQKRGVVGTQGKSLLGQRESGGGVAFLELLPHEPAHTDEARAAILEKRLVIPDRLGLVAIQLCGLGLHQSGDILAAEKPLGLGGLLCRLTRIAGGKRDHAVRKRV